MRLRATQPELPVLLVTGHIEPEQWSRIEGLAGVRHLGKPFLPADLLRLTRELSLLRPHAHGAVALEQPVR